MKADHERQITLSLLDCLSQSGFKVEHQTKCGAGRIDLVLYGKRENEPPLYVIEVKSQPGHHEIIKAFGQALSYSAYFFNTATPVVALDVEVKEDLISIADKLGVEIWQIGEQLVNLTAGTLLSPSFERPLCRPFLLFTKEILRYGDLPGFLKLLKSSTVSHYQDYYTLKEASRIKGLPATYLKRQIKAGVLPAVKVAGWRIKREDLKHHDVISE